jgi:hypothetical protein
MAELRLERADRVGPRRTHSSPGASSHPSFAPAVHCPGERSVACFIDRDTAHGTPNGCTSRGARLPDSHGGAERLTNAALDCIFNCDSFETAQPAGFDVRGLELVGAEGTRQLDGHLGMSHLVPCRVVRALDETSWGTVQLELAGKAVKRVHRRGFEPVFDVRIR